LGVGLLAGIVALVLAYMRGCIPGLGVGSSSAPATSAPQKSESAPAKADVAAALQLTVDGDRCRRGDENPLPCDQLCRALGTEQKTTKVEVDGTLGTHAAVDALRKCLAAQGFRDVVVRAE
jgi:hypothetical protein